MKTASLALAVVAFAGLVGPRSDLRADQLARPASPPSELVGGVPDISGVWFASFVPTLAPSPPMLPAAEAIMKMRKPEDDPMARCLPPGVPRVGSTAFPIEILQSPGRVTILYEYDHFVRRIFTDGRKHPEDLGPTWLGHTIGHWEGKTLVADTVGLNDVSWLDQDGHPASDALHVIERYTKSDDGQSLLHEITIDDSKMYREPWKSSKTYAFSPHVQIMERVCER